MVVSVITWHRLNTVLWIEFLTLYSRKIQLKHKIKILLRNQVSTIWTYDREYFCDSLECLLYTFFTAVSFSRMLITKNLNIHSRQNSIKNRVMNVSREATLPKLLCTTPMLSNWTPTIIYYTATGHWLSWRWNSITWPLMMPEKLLEFSPLGPRLVCVRCKYFKDFSSEVHWCSQLFHFLFLMFTFIIIYWVRVRDQYMAKQKPNSDWYCSHS